MCLTPPLSHFCSEERNSVDCWIPTPGIMLGTPEGLSECHWANEWSERKRVDTVLDSLVRAASWGMSQHRSSWVIYSLQVWEIQIEYSFPLFFPLSSQMPYKSISTLFSRAVGLLERSSGVSQFCLRGTFPHLEVQTQKTQFVGALPSGVCSVHGIHIETRPKAKQK